MRIPLILLILSFHLSSFSQGGTFVPKTTSVSSTTPKKTPTQKPTQNNTSSGIILIVSPATVPCSNNPANQCLQIKKQGSAEYETVEDIENFNYDMGYTYTVQVKEIMKTPPIGVGESIYRYIWIKTLSKKEVIEEEVRDNADLTPNPTYQAMYSNGKVIGQTNIITGSELDKRWYLRKMKESEGSSFVTDDNVMWIEINTFNDRIDGFGACNKFAAVVKSDLNTTFNISKLTSNYSLCGNKKLEDLFYDLLQNANRFEIRNGNLILSDQWKFLLGFTSNPDNKEDISMTYAPQNIVKNDEKIYATSEKNEDKYVPSTVATAITENATTLTSSSSTSKLDNTSETERAAVIESKNKEIEELKRQLAEQQKSTSLTKQTTPVIATDVNIQTNSKTESSTKIINTVKSKEELEQEKLQSEAAELKKQLAEKKAQEESEKILALKKQQDEDARKQAELEKIKLEKIKEIEELKKQLAEKEKEISSTQSVNNPKTEVNNIIPQKSITTNTSIASNNSKLKSKENNYNIPDLALENVVYYKKGDNFIPLDRTNATYKGSSKNSYLEIATEESTLQYHQKKTPQLFIKLGENIDSDDYIQLHICSFIKNKRIVNLSKKTNTINISLNKVNNNIYKLILPDNLEINEYVIITKTDYAKLDSSVFNSSTIQISCFGINEVK